MRSQRDNTCWLGGAPSQLLHIQAICSSTRQMKPIPGVALNPLRSTSICFSTYTPTQRERYPGYSVVHRTAVFRVYSAVFGDPRFSSPPIMATSADIPGAASNASAGLLTLPHGLTMDNTYGAVLLGTFFGLMLVLPLI